MLKAVERWVSNRPPTPDEEIDRLLYLEELLEYPGFLFPYYLVLKWHSNYMAHGVYPFGRGTYGDQPAALLGDFDEMDLLYEREELRKKHRKDMSKEA